MTRKSSGENIFLQDDMIDTASRARIKPAGEASGPVAKGKKVGLQDAAILPFSDENASSAAESKDDRFHMESIFRIGKKDDQTYFDNPLAKRSTRSALAESKGHDNTNAQENTQGVRITVSKKSMGSKRKRAGDEENDGAAETKAESKEGYSDGLKYQEVQAKESVSEKKQNVSFGGIDERFISTRSSVGRTDPPSSSSGAARSRITTPMSTRKRARLSGGLGSPMPYTELAEDEVEEMFSKVRHNHMKKVEKALARGINPDAQNVHGNTMLHIAAQNNLVKMANLLMGYGAQPTVTNRKGFSALDFAETYKFSKMADFLVEHGAERGRK